MHRAARPHADVHCFLPALMLCLGLLAVPVMAVEGPDAFVLPTFGDPQFLPVPDGGSVGQMDFRSDPDTPTDVRWYPNTNAISRLVSTGGLSVSWRRGDRQLQAVADSLIYERSSPAANAIETFTLIGNVVVVTPEGGIRAASLTLTHYPFQAAELGRAEVSARGGIEAQFNQHSIIADQVRLIFPEGPAGAGPDARVASNRGLVEGEVRLRLPVKAVDSESPSAPAVIERPMFNGIDLNPQQMTITGPRFGFTFDGEGLQTVEADAPSILTLERQDPLQGDATPTSMTIATPIFHARFAPDDPGPPGPGAEPTAEPSVQTTLLRYFEAPAGILLTYLDGTIKAGTGELTLDPDRQSLRLTEGVRAEQGGALMIAKELDLSFDEAGKISLEATGRPTFLFETDRFAPLAEIFGELRPGGVAP